MDLKLKNRIIEFLARLINRNRLSQCEVGWKVFRQAIRGRIELCRGLPDSFGGSFKDYLERLSQSVQTTNTGPILLMPTLLSEIRCWYCCTIRLAKFRLRFDFPQVDTGLIAVPEELLSEKN